MSVENIWTKEIPEEKKGLSGSTLKLIAVITMIIDHIGAVVLGRYLAKAGFLTVWMHGTQADKAVWFEQNRLLYTSYEVTRLIGRIAFPIYCFLLVEGFFKSKNRLKYGGRLFLFALLSEIPFNLALHSTFLYPSYQNVFLELLAGLTAIAAVDALRRRIQNKFLSIPACIGVIALIALAAQYTGMDYGAIGIACIVLLYVSAARKPLQITVGVMAFLWEYTAPLAFLPVAFYNGKRGLSLKYFFYIIYPAHLLLLYLLCVLLGIDGYPAV